MISQPEFHASAGGIYDLRFKAEQIAVRVDKIHQKGESLTGEIRVINKAPGVAPLLHQTRFNLLSTQSRRTVAKYLATRVEVIDWDAIIESVCIHVLTAFREGEPVINVGDMPLRPTQNYRLSPLLLEREANLIYGAGGTGKSYLSCFIGTLVQSGKECCGWTPTQGNVLYLDYETSQDEINHRVQLLWRGLSLPSCTLAYRFCSQSLANEINVIQGIVNERKISLVIVDSVGGACGGEPESAEVVLRYFMALRSLKITSLSIDHITKHGENKSPFGSIFKYNAARSIYELRSSQDSNQARLDIGLYHRKCNAGKLQHPLGLHLAFFEDGVIFERTEIAAIPSLATGLPLQDQIAFALSRGAMSVKEIALAIDAKADSVEKTLKRNKRRFVQADPGGKRWGLLSSYVE